MTHNATSKNSSAAVFCALAGLLLLSSPGWTTTPTTPPAGARPMTGYELYVLYRDRSWEWNNGAGRMEDEARIFKAWTGSGDDAAWATGRWIVKDSGKLCLQADWHMPSGKVKNMTCFSHRISDGTIYQKRDPAGDWYVFRHSQPVPDDEFGKLVEEDLVSGKLETLKKQP